jgi:hypothetical protein
MQKNIYLARQEETSLYKIGITKNKPLLRVKQLQTGNANPIILVETFVTNHNFIMETALHAHFSLKKREGEWFELSDDDVKNFKSLCMEKEATMDFLKKNNYFWS